MTPAVGFLGLGEAGGSIAKGLKIAGIADITAFDIKLDKPETAGAIKERAAAAGVALVQGPAGVAAGSGIVIAAVTADQSLIAADAIRPHLTERHIYVDINSTSPMTKQEAAEIVEASGARYVDAAVMASVPPHAHKVPMLICGKGAADFAAAMRPFGMRLEVLGEAVGPASATKMFRSIIMKGIDALLVESVLAASRHGVDERVLRTVTESFPGLDWLRLAHEHIGRSAQHGLRRAHEMEEVVKTLESMGIEPIMAEAIRHRLQWGVDRGLSEKFGNRAPERYEEVLRALGSPKE